MRTFARSIFFLASVSGGVFSFTGCTADCEEKGTCGPYAPTGGSAGDAGGPGTGGSSGTSGSGGSAATGGTGGGAQAGEGGSGESGGASGDAGGNSASGGASGSAGDAGSGGDAGMTGGEGGAAGGGEPVCDPALAPFEDACVVHEDFGVFVSPDGDDDDGDGSRENPFASLDKGITEAIASNKRVYACADGDAYSESVTLGSDASGLEMFGGFACDDWSYDTTSRSQVTSPTPLALRIVDADDVRIEDFGFTAADGAMPGGSSIGSIVANSTDIVLRRVAIEAGDGVEGADGTLEAFTYPEQSALNGNSEGPAGMGGGQKVCACQGALMSIGGGGGTPNASGQAGSKGLPDHGAGAGGTPAGCGSGGTGIDGANAPHATLAAGASALGSASLLGWTPASGDDGSVGQPGQGGGGGASRTDAGHGGGGGCGGCGGNGGGAGQGGGASIALLVLDSTLVIDASSLVSANAANGGNGQAGQVGQVPQPEGGLGGQAINSSNSCDGGNGGHGGNGGAGGGGAGGISIGILWSGDDAPTQSEIAFTIGNAGDGGIGGDPGNNDGLAGVEQTVLEVL